MYALVETSLFSAYCVGAHNTVAILNLQFADDTLLVEVKSWANVRALKFVLILFEAISGLKVNFFKSILFCFNVSD